MKRVLAGIAGVLLLGLCRGAWAGNCRQLRESVEVGAGNLSLADLLPPGECPGWYAAAAQVSLGAAPRAGMERVFEGAEIRGRLAALGARGGTFPAILPAAPERIVVRRAESEMTCADLARFLQIVPWEASDPPGRNDLHCSARVPAGAALELRKSSWNPLLRRWEFALRCRRAGECVPFLAWSAAGGGDAANPASDPPQTWVVKRGETATLTWDEAGIRVVMPVTCLEAGRLGQSIRVRLENAARTMRAKVVGAGALRVSL